MYFLEPNNLQSTDVGIKGSGVYGGLLWQGGRHCLSVHMPVWPGRAQSEIPQHGQMYVGPPLLLNAPGRYLLRRRQASQKLNLRMVPVTITICALQSLTSVRSAKDSYITQTRNVHLVKQASPEAKFKNKFVPNQVVFSTLLIEARFYKAMEALDYLYYIGAIHK